MENITSFEELANLVAENSNLTTTQSAGVVGGLFGILAGMIAVVIVVALVIYVLLVIAQWKIFTKAGEAGWKSIIPFYNIAILYKISNMSPWLVLVYIGTIIPILNIFAGIAIYVFTLYQKINLAKGFNKETGFTVGMIVLPTIYSLILGLGDSKYIGFEDNKENNE